MSDRLDELLRQKALLATHAAWLDREIAQEREKTGGTAAAEPSPAAPEAAAAGEARVDAILDQYRSPPQSIRQEIRRGCLLYFFGSLLLVGISLLGIYLAYRRR